MLFTCNHCGFSREVADAFAGKSGKCPQCQERGESLQMKFAAGRFRRGTAVRRGLPAIVVKE